MTEEKNFFQKRLDKVLDIISERYGASVAIDIMEEVYEREKREKIIYLHQKAAEKIQEYIKEGHTLLVIFLTKNLYEMWDIEVWPHPWPDPVAGVVEKTWITTEEEWRKWLYDWIEGVIICG